VREADLLLHIADISHPDFEEQIRVVADTLREIGAGEKPVYLVFNKIDAYSFVEKDEDDLTPPTQINISLDSLKDSWLAKSNSPCIFISAKERTNINRLKDDIYRMVAEIDAGRYPFDNFIW
jgi:GTP-binding protein HflX